MTDQLEFDHRPPMNVSICRRLTTEEGFREWIGTKDGSLFSIEFVRLARSLKDRGCKHYGAKAVCEYIRFNRALKQGPDGFKLNNNVVSRLARWAMQNHEDLKGFFSVRELKGKS